MRPAYIAPLRAGRDHVDAEHLGKQYLGQAHPREKLCVEARLEQLHDALRGGGPATEGCLRGVLVIFDFLNVGDAGLLDLVVVFSFSGRSLDVTLHTYARLPHFVS